LQGFATAYRGFEKVKGGGESDESTTSQLLTFVGKYHAGLPIIVLS
jgi:hypothetical protein